MWVTRLCFSALHTYSPMKWMFVCIYVYIGKIMIMVMNSKWYTVSTKLRVSTTLIQRWQFRLPIALPTNLSRITKNCGKYPSCGCRINFTQDYIALVFGVNVFSRVSCFRVSCKRRLAGENDKFCTTSIRFL